MGRVRMPCAANQIVPGVRQPRHSTAMMMCHVIPSLVHNIRLQQSAKAQIFDPSATGIECITDQPRDSIWNSLQDTDCTIGHSLQVSTIVRRTQVENVPDIPNPG